MTVRQPWASLIAAGVKTIETRSQRTHHRGSLAIHAGKRPPGQVWWYAHMEPNLPVWWHDKLEGIYEFTETNDGSQCGYWWNGPLGAIVAVAEVVDCVPIVHMGEECAVRRVEGADVGSLWLSEPDDEDAPGEGDTEDIIGQLPYGDFTPGRWAWLLGAVRPLAEPIVCRGAQGLWNVPGDIEARLAGVLA